MNYSGLIPVENREPAAAGMQKMLTIYIFVHCRPILTGCDVVTSWFRSRYKYKQV